MATQTPTISVYVAGLVTFKKLTSNVATLTLADAHNLIVGDSVVVASEDATFNGTYTVTAVGSSGTGKIDQFSYAKTAGDVASTAGSGTGIVTPSNVKLTMARPELPLICKDTTSYSPNPTSRSWRNGTTASGKPVNLLPSAETPTGVSTLKIRRSTGTNGAQANQTINMFCSTDSNATTAASTNVTIAVTDSVLAAAVAAQTTNAIGAVTTNMLDASMPPEYRDPTICTPGVPTACELAAAKAYGTILPTASQAIAFA